MSALCQRGHSAIQAITFLRPQESAGFCSLFRWASNQRPVQRGNRLRELIVMQDIVFRYTTNRRSQFSQNVSEQAKVDMHVNCFADIVSTRPFEDQRNAGWIDMRLKSR
jgi:hypothetical protein